MRTTTLIACLALFAALNVQAGAHEDAAIAAEHAHDSPVATGAALTEPTSKVTGETVRYGEVDGTPLYGYLARPAGATGALPGLIVIHEWWGLNDNIRKTAERLAGEGFVALAVDLYGGESAAVPKEAMRLMSALNQGPDRALDNLGQANRYLMEAQSAPRTGSIGWCLGGRWSLQTALLLPTELDAAVIYYGSLVTDEAQLATLEMPILGNFASDDPIIPVETVNAFTATLQSLGKDVDVKIYPNTKHAFSNPSGLAYEPEAAQDAWNRSVGFLRTHLVR
jgi:carboxymethylenebutenolidase